MLNMKVAKTHKPEVLKTTLKSLLAASSWIKDASVELKTPGIVLAIGNSDAFYFTTMNINRHYQGGGIPPEVTANIQLESSEYFFYYSPIGNINEILTAIESMRPISKKIGFKPIDCAEPWDTIGDVVSVSQNGSMVAMIKYGWEDMDAVRTRLRSINAASQRDLPSNCFNGGQPSVVKVISPNQPLRNAAALVVAVNERIPRKKRFSL